ncbi:hypothetical protein SRHO_G00312610 [Serrasalmus rhombeus]
MLRPLCNSPPCGCWGGCLPKIPFFCFEDKTLERQIEEDFLRHLQRESRETERELEEMKREVRRLKKNQCKLVEKGRRQQEKERKKEERERAQRKKSMERMRLSQIERSELDTLRELELRQLSELRALERESRSSDREPHTPARKMDALQQPWTGAGQQGLLPLHSQNVVDLHIEDIHLMITSDAQKPSKLVVLEETMRRNAAKILQLKEEEEELKRELEELKLRMASMIKSREEDRLPELGLQRGMERQIRMEKKLHAMKRELEREQEEQWKQAEERLREMEKRMMEERESIERREEKWREMLKKAEEEWGQIDEEEDEAEVGASSQADDIKESVLQTPQKGSMVQCCVQRDRTDKSGPTYRMFQELEDGKKQLLLVARRMKKNNTSSYVITDGESDEDHNVVGRLSFNRQRTQFTLSDSVRNPTKSSGALQEESSTQELLALSYESLFGFMKSQQMTAVIPSPDRNSQRVSFVEGSLLKQLKRKNQGPNLIKLNTKEPVWSSKQKAHVLDFNGRVKKASLKNFQLACPANPDEKPSLDTKEPERKKKQKAYVLDLNGRVKKGAVKNFQLACPANPDEKVIQFGRVDEDHFLQDCSFHLCTLQAFAITSTSDLNTVYTCTVHTHVPITSSPFNKNNKTREVFPDGYDECAGLPSLRMFLE